MYRKKAEKRLAELGFKIDWSVTGKNPIDHYFVGTIDPIERMSINGDCRGCVIHGDSASDFYNAAVAEAEDLQDDLTPCEKPIGECDYHDHE